MDPKARLDSLKTWAEKQSDEPKKVSGSVVEFAFGDRAGSYLATSYPYRAEYVQGSDVRSIKLLNMPFVREKLELIKPAYIMNVAIDSADRWFMYYYQGRHFAHESKWFPVKPSAQDGGIGEILTELKENETDQVSFCAFGETPASFFLRSTDAGKNWHPRLSPHVPPALHSIYQAELNRFHRPRAVTFGQNGTWILYSEKSFKWSKRGLPPSLEEALKDGASKDWTINKAVLNRRNRKEYVLVYNNGTVHCSFHPDFVEPFKEVLGEWSGGMRQTNVEFPDHKLTFIYEPPSDGVDNSIGPEALNELLTIERVADHRGSFDLQGRLGTRVDQHHTPPQLQGRVRENSLELQGGPKTVTNQPQTPRQPQGQLGGTVLNNPARSSPSGTTKTSDQHPWQRTYSDDDTLAPRLSQSPHGEYDAREDARPMRSSTSNFRAGPSSNSMRWGGSLLPERVENQPRTPTALEQIQGPNTYVAPQPPESHQRPKRRGNRFLRGFKVMFEMDE